MPTNVNYNAKMGDEVRYCQGDAWIPGRVSRLGLLNEHDLLLDIEITLPNAILKVSPFDKALLAVLPPEMEIPKAALDFARSQKYMRVARQPDNNTASPAYRFVCALCWGEFEVVEQNVDHGRLRFHDGFDVKIEESTYLESKLACSCARYAAMPAAYEMVD
jgi:hypothetical protein